MKNRSELNRDYKMVMEKLVGQQIKSLSLVMGTEKIRTIIIDGGFSKNDVFVKMLANKLDDYEIKVAPTGQGSALGAAVLVR